MAIGSVDSTNGGWAEQEDRDSRERDRDNGNDGSYERRWNDRLANDRFGYGGLYNERTADTFGSYGSHGVTGNSSTMFGHRNNSISGAVNNVRGSISPTNRNSLTNNSLAQITNSEVNARGPYSPSLDPEKMPNIFDKYAPENFARVRDIAGQDWIDDSERRRSLNAMGALGSGNVAEMAASAVKNPNVGRVVGMVAGLATGKIGDVANAVAGKARREGLSKVQQSMYDPAYSKFTKENKEHRSDIGDRIVDGLAFVGDVLTENPLGTLGYLANAYNEKDAFLDTLKGNPEVKSFQAELDRQKSAKISPHIGGGGEQKGLLNTMYSRLKETEEPTVINEIPKLSNYWGNITIK